MAGTSSNSNYNPNNPADPYHDNEMMKPYEFLFNRFPPGFKFLPSDEELILQYLTNKLLNIPLPTNKILDLNIYNFSPMQLSEMHKYREEEEMYFFSPRDKKYPNSKRPSRITGDGKGFWKATGKDKQIFNQRKKLIIGSRKTLVFYEGKPKHGERKTNWIMHEYIIDESIVPTSTTSTRAPGDNRLDDWVMCKMYPSKMSELNPNTGNEVKTEMTNSVPLEDFEHDLPPMLEFSATPDLGQQYNNVSIESEQALDNPIMTVQYGSTTGFQSQHVTDSGARSWYPDHEQQRNASLLSCSLQLPVINSVSDAISSLAGGDNNNGTMTTPYDGSNGSENVLNLDNNLHAHLDQQDLPSFQNTSMPSIIDSVGSAIASLADCAVFHDMAFRQVPHAFRAEYGIHVSAGNGIQTYYSDQTSPQGTEPHQSISMQSLDNNGFLPPLPQCYYYYNEPEYDSF